jgi:hypothetical protein
VGSCFNLVFHCATDLEAGDTSGAERKHFPRRSGRMGTNVQYLSEVLARVDFVGRPWFMDYWTIAEIAMAGLIRLVRSSSFIIFQRFLVPA